MGSERVRTKTMSNTMFLERFLRTLVKHFFLSSDMFFVTYKIVATKMMDKIDTRSASDEAGFKTELGASVWIVDGGKPR